MRALVKKSNGYDNMEIMNLEEVVATRDLVKIKVAYAGICGTDLHSFKGEYASIKPPITLGHEFSGIVVAIGEDVKNIKVGDRVSSETTFETCGKCVHCKRKDYNLCSKRKGLGTQINGGFAEYVLSREESLHIIPENVSLLSASISEPLACCVHAAHEVTEVKEGDLVVVFGPGAMGLLTALTAKAYGARVVLAGITKDEIRFELAKKIGIEYIVDQLKENVDEIILDMSDGVGADIVFECSGSPVAIKKSFDIVKKTGEIVQLGLFANPLIEIDSAKQFNKEIVYKGSRTQKPSAWRETMRLLEKKLPPIEQIITLVLDLENWREGFEKSINAEEVKVVLRCNDVGNN